MVVLTQKKCQSYLYYISKKKKKKKNEVTIKAYRNDSQSYSTTYPTCDSTNVYAKNNYTLIQSNEI